VKLYCPKRRAMMLFILTSLCFPFSNSMNFSCSKPDRIWYLFSYC